VGRFVFLDRDGTLIRDHGYVHRLEDYELLPGVVEALARLARAGFGLAVVTNQSGIGRGYYDEAAYERIRARLEDDLAARGIRIARSYHCPHRPDQGCACRKPAPGMLLRARDELGADLAASWVVGNHPTDVELAKRAGCAGGVLLQVDPATAPAGVLIRRDLAAAAELILANAVAVEEPGGP
jgi:D-glycero-D-manno-heptose 1,7-bisphosphate phosphatase